VKYSSLSKVKYYKQQSRIGPQQSSGQTQLVIIARALASTELKLKYFKREEDYQHSMVARESIWVDWFRFKQKELQAVQNSLRDLESFKFHLNVIVDMADENEWLNRVRHGGFSSLLTNFSSLETLNVEFQVFNGEFNYDDILNCSFHRLRRLRLEGLITTETRFMRFLQNHAKTLREVHFEQIRLEDGDWLSILKNMRQGLHLDSFGFERLTSPSNDSSWDYWIYDGHIYRREENYKGPVQLLFNVEYIYRKTDIDYTDKESAVQPELKSERDITILSYKAALRFFLSDDIRDDYFIAQMFAFKVSKRSRTFALQ
jgi:hypothetical protein